MKSNANIVAKQWADWDHEIYPEKSNKALFVQNYKPLSDQKTSAMKKYIDKHLGKGFIWSSLSAAAFLILLVRKLERGFHFCINYWALNAVTIKNKYSILLIFKTLGKLAEAVK